MERAISSKKSDSLKLAYESEEAKVQSLVDVVLNENLDKMQF